jgi:endoglucanase
MDLELLRKVCDTPGTSGYEHRVRSMVKKEVEPLVDVIRTDNLGNLIAIKRGKKNPDGKKVMVAAHMDEIGFMVNHIDDKGFLRFHTLGGFDPKTLTSMRVTVHGKEDLPGVMGAKPIHIMKPEERKKAPDVKDYYIDLGLPAEKVKELVEVGDVVTRRQEVMEMGEVLNGKSFDNRISVYILIKLLQELKTVPYDLYAVFSVQEEVGIRGANVAAHTIEPDFGIGLDVTIAFDTPESSKHLSVTELGKGAAIKIYDSSTICDYRMVQFMKQTANKYNITWQPEALQGGGTDTAGIQRMGKNGAIAGALSIPLRYMHQVTETIHPEDVDGVLKLLKACTEEMDQFDWNKDY